MPSQNGVHNFLTSMARTTTMIISLKYPKQWKEEKQWIAKQPNTIVY